ncbi:hypothetical protein SESBI_00773 [Sesbania bispinosa]|nr:hypothetical protein SESBI_00773 [Sesbania bispinosa]
MVMTHLVSTMIEREGLVVKHATWEDHTTLKATFPNLNLEDKVALNGGGIVTSENTEGTNEEMHKGESQDAIPERQVATDVQNQRKRMSDRIKITNSRLRDYVWAGSSI